MYKILVADDDPNVLEIIRLYFEKQQFTMIEAHDGLEAVNLVEKESPDIVLLDVMMPRMDGYEAFREIRKNSDIPIIMLSAKGEEFDKVLGLELGADDYVTKPFSPRELTARIKAIFRRIQPRTQSKEILTTTTTNLFEFNGLTINIEKRDVLVNGNRINFKPREFDLLVHLVKSPGIVFTREQLLEQVWGYDYIGDIRTVDVHIKKIRHKLNDLKQDYVVTIWGVGYKFEVGNDARDE